MRSSGDYAMAMGSAQRVIGALSGYGMMASNSAADLLADYIAERPLPRYAPAFHLDRYDDPAYAKLLESWGDSGQL